MVLRPTLFMTARSAALCTAVLLAVSLATASAQVDFDTIATIEGPADAVEIHDGHIFTTHHTDLRVFDVSDPAKPREVGALSFPEEIWGFRITNDRAYVGANFHGLAIVDISDPALPTVIGVHKTLGQTKIGAVYGNRVALIDHMEGFVLIDTSDEASPESVGSFFLDGYARDVVTSGSIAYATDSPTGLYIFDLSRDGLPEPVGVLHAPSAPRTSLAVSQLPGGATLLTGVSRGNLQVFDVSDPTSPVKTSDFDTPGNAFGVAVQDQLAYVADGAAGLQVVDLTDPASPQVVGAFQTTRPARAVSVVGSLVVVVVGDSEREGNDRDIVILRQTR